MALKKTQLLDITSVTCINTVGIFTVGVTPTAGGVGVAQSTVFETGAGWVGVTTYRDNTGVERVKKEILVAMSGITTGTDSELYPPHVGE